MNISKEGEIIESKEYAIIRHEDYCIHIILDSSDIKDWQFLMVKKGDKHMRNFDSSFFADKKYYHGVFSDYRLKKVLNRVDDTIDKIEILYREIKNVYDVGKPGLKKIINKNYKLYDYKDLMFFFYHKLEGSNRLYVVSFDNNITNELLISTSENEYKTSISKKILSRGEIDNYLEDISYSKVVFNRDNDLLCSYESRIRKLTSNRLFNTCKI